MRVESLPFVRSLALSFNFHFTFHFSLPLSSYFSRLLSFPPSPPPPSFSPPAVSSLSRSSFPLFLSFFLSLPSLLTSLPTPLHHVSLSNNAIEVEGTCALAGALDAKPGIVKFNLCHNKLGDGGAAALAGVLREHTTLQRLDLAANNIALDGMVALAGAIKDNTTLSMLGFVM